MRLSPSTNCSFNWRARRDSSFYFSQMHYFSSFSLSLLLSLSLSLSLLSKRFSVTTAFLLPFISPKANYLEVITAKQVSKEDTSPLCWASQPLLLLGKLRRSLSNSMGDNQRPPSGMLVRSSWGQAGQRSTRSERRSDVVTKTNNNENGAGQVGWNLCVDLET